MTHHHPIRIFIAYSREDASLLTELRKHLKPLERTEKVEIWYDGNIDAGELWEEKIKEAIYSSEIILLLVSADSISSDYFYGKEVAAALNRQEKGEATVIPLIVRSCDWKRIKPLSNLQAVPQNGVPITSDKWNNHDDAWFNAIASIGTIVDERLMWKQKIIADQISEEERIKQAEHEAERLRIQAIKNEKERKAALEEEKKRREEEKKRREEEIAAELQRNTDFQAAVAAAEQSFAGGHWQQAVTSYKNALYLYRPGDSPNAEALSNGLQNCAIKQQEELVEQENMLHDREAEIHTDYAQTFFDQGEYEKAFSYVGKALNIRPGHQKATQLFVEISHWYARTYLENGEHKAALFHVGQALQFLPGHAETIKLEKEIRDDMPKYNFRIKIRNIALFIALLIAAFFFVQFCYEITFSNNTALTNSSHKQEAKIPSSCLEESPNRKNVLDKIRQRGEIRIVVESESSPFNYLDQGKSAGFDYEIARAIAAEIGVHHVKMIYMEEPTGRLDYSTFPCAFNYDIADCFMGGYVEDEALNNLVLWSEPYFDQIGLALIVKKGSKIKNKYDLEGKHVAVYPDEAAQNCVKALKGIPHDYIDSGNSDWIKKALDSDTIDAVVYDYPFAEWEVMNLDPKLKEFEFIEYNLNNLEYVIGLPQGNEDLQTIVNNAITKIRKNETKYKELVKNIDPDPSVFSIPPIEPKYQYDGPSHTVQAGETLSRIVFDKFRNVRLWEQVWEWNKDHIANPHLIKPGDVIIFDEPQYPK